MAADSEDDDYDDPQTQTLNPAFRFLIMILLFWQSVYKITDSAIAVLWKLLLIFFNAFSRLFQVPAIREAAEKLPKSLPTLRREVNIDLNTFAQYVVCVRCHSLYEYKECLTERNGKQESMKCMFVEYPRHPQQSRRQPCGEMLLKYVKSVSGKCRLKPRKVFCSYDLITSISKILNENGIINLLQEWKSRVNSTICLSDVYDGRLWKEFQAQCSNDSNSVCEVVNLAFMLNVDWFNPFKTGTYSAGVIYLTILNIPRRFRFKENYTILAGLIPGPHEPSLSLNSYLTPLVQQLDALNDGIRVSTVNNGNIIVYGRLLCVSSDIPASRKICGFLGHHAKMACNKCYKEFKRVNDKTDYSGYDVSGWKLRTNCNHRKYIAPYYKLETQKKRKELENKYGIRSSVLLDLQYFDVIRSCVIDPMHNLFLGTSKHIMHLWLSNKILSIKDLTTIQDKVNSLNVPNEIGRIPCKIASSFADFTADEWKNWTLIYSLYCLHDVLPQSHFQVWKMFVKVCRKLCKHNILIQDALEAQTLLVAFNKRIEGLYGPQSCTMNMHLHCHIFECILDMGPIYSFWCFPYERMNGLLGAYPTNNHNITVQMMRKFLMHSQLDHSLLKCQLPTDLHSDLDSSVHLLNRTASLSGSQQLSVTESLAYEQMRDFIHLNPALVDLQCLNCTCCLASPIKETFFDSFELDQIKDIYTNVLYGPECEIDVPRLHLSSQNCVINEQYFTSEFSLTQKSSYIHAHWPKQNLQLGNVQKFVLHTVQIRQRGSSEIVKKSYIMAFVRWNDCLDFSQFNQYKETFFTWSTLQSHSSFLPVHRIFCKAAVGITDLSYSGIKLRIAVSVPVHEPI